jgi:hypothetical protein
MGVILPTRSGNAATAIKILKDIVFPRFGVPMYLMTNGGSHFLEGTLRKTLAKYGVTHRVASPYHTNTSDQVELSNIDKNDFAKDSNKS